MKTSSPLLSHDWKRFENPHRPLSPLNWLRFLRTRVGQWSLILAVSGSILFTMTLRGNASEGLYHRSVGVASTFFGGVDSTTIDAIEVHQPNGALIHLKREGQAWSVLDGETWHPVSPRRVQRMFSTDEGEPEIDGSLFVQLHGDNPYNHDRVFGVTPQTGVRVRFLKENNVREDLFIGRKTLGKTYIRRPDESQVYLVACDLTDNFAGAFPRDWRQRDVLSLDGADGDIRSLSLWQGDTLVYRLTQARPGTWNVEDGQQLRPARPSAVQGALRQLRALSYLSFATASPATAADATTQVLRVATTAGPERAFTLYADPTGRHWELAEAGAEFAYRVQKPVGLLRSWSDFVLPGEALAAHPAVDSSSAPGG
ncbi:MAG: DUF4340 domain-containing protein [Sumerlaeia bacterium]